MRFLTALLLLLQILRVGGKYFPYERVQLSESDVVARANLKFGKTSGQATNSSSNCKTYPGDTDWPSLTDWGNFNDTLGGALIKTVPPAWPCHNGPFGTYDAGKCSSVKSMFSNSSFHMNDPASIMSSWASGSACPPEPSAPCTIDGYPVYVVNATTVKQIQLAVNFARNNNIRFVIKNTGHEFNGKSTGAGSLSVWVHHLKSFEYIPAVTIGNYSGKAARVGTGLQAFDLYPLMNASNITLLSPGGDTVGAYGGYMQGGGHSVISPLFGLGADQPLSMQVVTADGRFVTADPQTNSDLFWAMRGGGGSTFGVMTSAVVKALPVTSFASLSIAFNAGLDTSAISVEAFWEGVRAYFKDILRQAEVNTYGLFVINTPTTSQSFSMSLKMIVPRMTVSELTQFMSPFLSELKALGINASLANSLQHHNSFADYGFHQLTTSGIGDRIGNTRYSSRLFPKENFEPDTLVFNQTFDAIKAVVQAGYQIIGDAVAPTLQSAGYPDNAVNPAWRKAVLHATAIYAFPTNYTAAMIKEQHDRLDSLVRTWRELSPGAGSYLNEADIQEPDWQSSFYGSNYPRLLKVKEKWDPNGVFYATTGVGSEAWEVRASGGLPTQNGRLCRANTGNGTYGV
ncbi:FAD binding domain-containing protein [Glonium stellatum]|uniref:FAD binding domain-containing protein n=1 Tax=Glonium stellatum TaxID=574774 RepID=A0A8E2JVQ1_9PEZI|nr:FAD binding domain-containing protein [Glonium stellatum]